MDGDTIMYWWQGKRDGLFSRAPTALVLQKNHRVEGGELRSVFVSVSTFRRHGAAAGTFFDPGSPQNSGVRMDKEGWHLGAGDQARRMREDRDTGKTQVCVRA